MRRQPRYFASIWVVSVVVASAVFFVFLPVLGNGFVDWDDELTIVTNRGIRGLGREQLWWMFTSFHMGHYHPLTWLSLAGDYRLWGLDPAGYHLTNLVLHAINALLVFRLVLVVLERVVGARADASLGWWSAVGALVWAVHPLRVEAVAWATERRELLCAALLLATVLAYLRATDEEIGSRGYRTWLAGSLALLVLSLLAKAWGITLPAVLLILDLLVLGRRDHDARVSVARLLREKMLYLVVVLPFAVVGSAASRASGALLPLDQHGVLERTMQGAWALCFYLRTTLWPVGLSPIYDLERPLDPWQLRHVTSLVAVVVISAVSWSVRHRWAGVFAAWLCYVVLVAPTLGFAQSGPQKAADRYTYLCMVPWTVCLSGGCWSAWNRLADRRRSGRFVPAAFLAGMALVVVGLGALARVQTRHWRNSATLWAHAVDVNPESATAHNGLGLVYLHQGRSEDALAQFRTALVHREVHGAAHFHLGTLLAERGEVADALTHFTRAVEINPQVAQGYNGRGILRHRLGDLQGALADLDRAIQLDPTFTVAYGNRGLVHLDRGDPAAALADFDHVLRLDPTLSEAQIQRGRAVLALEGSSAGGNR